MINVLYLTDSFFMLLVYDRVLTSRSIPTLLSLCLLAAILYAFQGVLEFIRSRLVARIGAALDSSVAARVYELLVTLPLRSRRQGDGLQPLRDLDQVRTFLAGGGPLALFDLPWLPFYLAICFLFHPRIGLTALAGAVVLVAITLATELYTRGPAAEAARLAAERSVLAEAGRRSSEVLHAMGMAKPSGARWAAINRDYMAAQRRSSDVAGGLGLLGRLSACGSPRAAKFAWTAPPLSTGRPKRLASTSVISHRTSNSCPGPSPTTSPAFQPHPTIRRSCQQRRGLAYMT
jgi:ATP-binding cassette subfamily C protein